MKELSIEEKAKCYDEAIKRANSKWHYRNQRCFVDVAEIFPELKESEDGEEYLSQLMKRICIRADEWAHEPGNPAILAFAAVGYKMEQGEYQFKSDVMNKKETDYGRMENS